MAAASWTKSLHNDLTQFGTGGVYVNHLDGDEDRESDACGENITQLAEIRASYDPGGVFSR